MKERNKKFDINPNFFLCSDGGSEKKTAESSTKSQFFFFISLFLINMKKIVLSCSSFVWKKIECAGMRELDKFRGMKVTDF